MSHSKTYCQRQLLKFGISAIPRNNKLKFKNYHPVTQIEVYLQIDLIPTVRISLKKNLIRKLEKWSQIICKTQFIQRQAVPTLGDSELSYMPRPTLSIVMWSFAVRPPLGRCWLGIDKQRVVRERELNERDPFPFFFRFNKVHKMTDLSLVIS